MQAIVRIDDEVIGIEQVVRIWKLTGQFESLVEQFVRDRLTVRAAMERQEPVRGGILTARQTVCPAEGETNALCSAAVVAVLAGGLHARSGRRRRTVRGRDERARVPGEAVRHQVRRLEHGPGAQHADEQKPFRY